MNENREILTESQKLEHCEDEIELINYLLVIWKWKYVILSGTLAFGFAAAIISFIALKQQPTIYRTSIVLKTGVFEIDETNNKVFIDAPVNIKALIENDLEQKIFDDIKSSMRTGLSNSLKFQVDIPKGSNKINVSLESASAEDGTTKLNYLIKALSTEFTDRTKFIQKTVEKRVEEKKYEFEILLLKEKEIKTKIKKYEKGLSDIEANIEFFKNRKDISQNKEYMLTKLSLENDYRNTFLMYFKEKESAKFDLFKLQNQTNKLSREIEKLEKEKQNIQTIQIVQPPITTKLPKSNEIKRNLILSSVAGFFSMLFLSFFLEYLRNYKKRIDNK